MTTTAWVAGVDGCPAGWMVVAHPASRPDLAEVRIFPTFAAILSDSRLSSIIAIDIPIGLPDRVGAGGRLCDVAARAPLGLRQSSVFSVPSRSAVMQADYRAACREAALTSDPPRQVSKQAFNIFAKIREVDALMTPDLQSRVFECHPELVFWRLNGRVSLDLPKKIKSRPNPEGLRFRGELLAAAGYNLERLLDRKLSSAHAGDDDIIDAAANAKAATDILAGTALRVPDAPPCDARGLRMEIWG